MATIPASLEAQLDADWTGAGGAEPTYYSTEVFTYSNPPPMGKDFVWIVEKSLKTLSPRFNDLYANKTHTIDIIVNSGTTAARLKELSDEVERILNATAITGVHIQHIEARDLITPETTKNHLERVEVQMRTLLSASSTAYGAGATGDFDVLGDFTVAGDTELTGAFGFDTGEDVDIILDEDNMASDDEDALATQQSIKKYVDDQILTTDSLAEILAVGNEADGTDLILDSGADLIVYSDDKVTEKARIDGATGTLSIEGQINLPDTQLVDVGSYFGINPQGNLTLFFDGSSDQILRVYSANGGEYLQFAIINATHIADFSAYSSLSAGTTFNINTTTTGNSLITALSCKNNQDVHITGDLTITGANPAITGTEITELLMFGSANAVYVPCIFEWVSTTAAISTFAGMITNTGGTDYFGIWKLPLPPVKGSLKLYVQNVKVALYDADGGDKIINTWVYGLNNGTVDTLYTDATDMDDIKDWESGDELGAWGAADDASIYDAVVVQLQTECTNANDLEISGVSLECYYAT